MAENFPLLLLVEGLDDVHVISRLLEAHKLTDLRNKKKSVKPLELLFNNTPLDIVPVAGVDPAIKKFETEIEATKRYKTIGLVLDFDTPEDHRADAVKQAIRRLQNEDCQWNLPENFTVLTPEGFIAEPANEDTPRIGAWFMPDNQNRGMLETFLQQLIPKEQSGLLDHARNSTNIAKGKYKAPFRDVHQDKAVVHTFLAWMDEPGRPFGQSFQNGNFDAHTDLACRFVEWVKRLFP